MAEIVFESRRQVIRELAELMAKHPGIVGRILDIARRYLVAGALPVSVWNNESPLGSILI